MEKIRQLPIIDLQKKYGNRAFQMQLVNEADTPIRVRLFGNGKTFAEIVDKADPDTPEPEDGLQPAIECIYIELLGMAALGKLVPGQLYCVTDYDVQDITIKFGTSDVYIRSAKSLFTLVENRLFLTAVSADKVSCNGLLMNKNIGSYRFTDVIYDAPFSTGWMGEAPKWVDSTLANYRGCVVRMYNNAAGWDLPYDAFNMRVMKNGPIDPVSLVWGSNWNIRVASNPRGWLRYVYDADQPGSVSYINNVEILSMEANRGSVNQHCMIGFKNCQNMWIKTRQMDVDGEMILNGKFIDCENIRGKYIVSTQPSININNGLKNCTSDGTAYAAIGSGSKNIHLSLGETNGEYYKIDIGVGCESIMVSGGKNSIIIENNCRNIKILNEVLSSANNLISVDSGCINIEIKDCAGFFQIGKNCLNITVISTIGGAVGDGSSFVRIVDSEVILVDSVNTDIDIVGSSNIRTEMNSRSIKIGHNCSYIMLPSNCVDVSIADGCSNIEFESTAAGGFSEVACLRFLRNCRSVTIVNNETASSNNQFKNYIFGSDLDSEEITTLTRDRGYTTLVGYSPNGTLKIIPAIAN